ncbi:MAG TPA: pyridoxal-phosphate dependent enzyme [Flavitalea sp.]|nr:pyridoxal-phosphate dependent enzyme [Flavitalea sp.]
MKFPLSPVIDVHQACLQKLNHETFNHRRLSASVLRLDLIHPVISGNKWFKLKNYISMAQHANKKGVLTFGGAYSNHLHATAAICHLEGISAVGVIRGERPRELSPTLIDCENLGMQLIFISRNAYRHPEELQKTFSHQYPDLLLVAEGGQGDPGITGAAEIMELHDFSGFTHVLCAVGTGTMCAGILRKLKNGQQLLGVNVIKIPSGENNLSSFIANQSSRATATLYYDYHFGGYAKYSTRLLTFMNEWYSRFDMESDFVYTGKLFFAFDDLLKKEYFQQGDNILLIHSGGLQGNRSLPTGSLTFETHN